MTQPPEASVPTQIRHPVRATVRTVIAVVVSLASLLPYVAAQADVDAVPAVAQVLVVAAAITRIMAIPGVNEWLTSIGLGATPRT